MHPLKKSPFDREPILLHYSKEPLLAVMSSTDPRRVEITGKPEQPTASPKPTGLWVTPKGQECNWPDWCLREDFRLECLRHGTRVHIQEDANILLISTLQELFAFSEEYQAKDRLRAGEYLFNRYINWRRVAAKYKGILISPYQWEARLDESTFWYYGWDCASGCIWDASAISHLTIDEGVWLCPTVINQWANPDYSGWNDSEEYFNPESPWEQLRQRLEARKTSRMTENKSPQPLSTMEYIPF